MSELTLSVATPHHRTPVRGVALVLHGGRSRSTAPTKPNQLAVLRMIPFARSLQHADAGVAVARLRFRVRGWNGADRSPVADAREALDQLANRFPDVPIALVGHSMGGRTALYTADHEAVRAVVGLAPWVEPGDERATVAGLAGRRLLVVHGDADRMTDANASAAYAAAAARVATSSSYVSVAGGTHSMLARAGVWHELATGFVVGALFGPSPTGTVGASGTNDSSDGVESTLARALAGQAALVV